MVINIEVEPLLRWLDERIHLYGDNTTNRGLYVQHNREMVDITGLYFTGTDYHPIILEEGIRPILGLKSITNLKREPIASVNDVIHKRISTTPILSHLSPRMFLHILDIIQYDMFDSGMNKDAIMINHLLEDKIHNGQRYKSTPLLNMSHIYMEGVIDGFLPRAPITVKEEVMNNILNFFRDRLEEFFTLFNDKLIIYDLSKQFLILEAKYTPIEIRYMESLGERPLYGRDRL